VAWLVGESLVRSTSLSALVQVVVEVVADLVPVAAEYSSWSDVCGSSADDAAGVVGKAVVPLSVEGFVEAPELGDEEAEGFVVVVGAEVHAPSVEGGVEVVAAEGLGVFDLVVGVSVGPDGEGGAEESVLAHVSMIFWSSPIVTSMALLIFLVLR